MKRNIAFIGISLAVLYMIVAMSALPTTGIVWDETRYVSSAKARAYSAYAAITGAPGIEICSLEHLPPKADMGRCWDGRPRVFQTVHGFVWAGTFFLTDGNLDLMQSMAAHRIVTILLTALGILIVFLMSNELFGLKAGIFASLALIFIPRFLAHSRYATLDIQVSIMILATIYFFYKGMSSWKFGILSGVVFGLAIASKVNAYFTLYAIIPWLLISYRDRIMPVLRDIKKRTFRIRRIPAAFYSMIIFPVPVLILCWPWLWPDPIGRLMSYVSQYTVEGVGAAVYYMGEVFCFRGTPAPWHYAWVITGLTVPTFILIFAILGGYSVLKDTVSLRKRGSMLILLGALAPLLVFTFPISSRISPYTGVRLFLWTFPFIAMLAGLGASNIYDFIKSRFTGSRVRQAALIIIVMLIVIPGGMSVLKGHSNSATYYNSLIGGAGNALAAGFEVEYWGDAYFDVAMWLNENAKENSLVSIALAKNIFDYYKNGDIGEIVKRASEGRHNISSDLLEKFNISQGGILREDISITNETAGSDYYVLLIVMDDLMAEDESDRDIKMKRYFLECEPIYTVYSDGAPLASVYTTGCYEPNA